MVLKRGYTSDTKLNDWFKATVDAGANVERSEASIVVLDRDLEPIAQFNMEGLFPVEAVGLRSRRDVRRTHGGRTHDPP